jgi:hypothetical protein
MAALSTTICAIDDTSLAMTSNLIHIKYRKTVTGVCASALKSSTKVPMSALGQERTF